MNILQEIVNATTERIAKQKKVISLDTIKELANAKNYNGFPFEKALKKDDIAFICEVKKASPSKGVIAKNFHYIDIAKKYEADGASAISVLTEPYYFQGSDNYLREISVNVSVPLLRKDFVIDEYMIYESKVLGASAVLLICAILNKQTLTEYIGIAHDIELSALVETHDEKEVEMALNAGARIIGVNNRDLKTFEIDINTSKRLKSLVPKDKIFISESGIKTKQDIIKLREIGVDAVLLGEILMRGEKVENLR